MKTEFEMDSTSPYKSTAAENQDKDRLLIEYRKLLDPILDWGQTEGLEHGLKLGESITTAVLNRAKEYNQLRKRCEDLEAENKKLAESEQYYEGLVIAFSNDRDSLIKERDGIIEAMDSNRLTHNNNIQYLREYFNDLNKVLKRMPPERVPFDLLKIMNDGEFIFKVSQ